MKTIRKNIRRFLPSLFPKELTDRRGQSTTEYILILAVVVMVAMKFRTSFNQSLGGMLTNLTGQLQQAASSDTTN